jgi:hypothetical protein
MTDTERGMVEARAREALESVAACPPLTFTMVGHKRRVSGRQVKALTAAGLRIVDAAEDDRRSAELAALVEFVECYDSYETVDIPVAIRNCRANIQPIIERYRAAQRGATGDE